MGFHMGYWVITAIEAQYYKEKRIDESYYEPG